MSDAFQIIKVSIEIVAKYFGIALRYCAGWAVLITALYYLMYFVVPQGTNLYKGIYSLWKCSEVRCQLVIPVLANA